MGLVGPGPLEDHRRHAQGFGAILRDLKAATVLDLGSGGGLPGLVLAAESAREDEARGRPSAPRHWTLLDAREKSARFLGWAAEELELRGRVTVVHGRAEEMARGPLRGAFEAVCARGFGPPAVTAECAAGFLVVGGSLVVSEPPGERSGSRWPPGPLQELGFAVPTSVRAGFGYQILRLEREVPLRYPRRTGVPAKRPLF